MGLGIPLELITMLASGLMGGLMSIWSMSIKNKAETHRMTMERFTQQHNAHKEAREFQGTTGFQITRRLIALLATIAVIVWPKIVPVFWPALPVVVGYTVWNPGFLFFEGSEQIFFRTFTGLVITPLDTHLMSSIIGLYFGASLVRNAR